MEQPPPAQSSPRPVSHPSFDGPLFIVGVHRSGTKLLRDLLNRHPRVGIPTMETQFIPYLVRCFGDPPRLEQRRARQRLQRELERSTFFWVMRQRGAGPTPDQLLRSARLESWAGILEPLLRAFAPQDTEAPFICGDKTPGYMLHMPLLKRLFPAARFVHLLRDPRDLCLSARKLWGKSLVRTAEHWRRAVARARRDARQLGPCVLELRYEDLLRTPRRTLARVCELAAIDLRPQMLSLLSPVEDFGTMRQRIDIATDNRDKYVAQLPPATVRRIEEVVYPVARELGYEPRHATRYRQLSAAAELGCAAHDGLQALRYHVRTKGLRQGVWFMQRELLQRSWRTAGRSP